MQIPGVPGPEDFALDRDESGDRLLISSHERRAWLPGEIYAFSLSDPKPAFRVMKRIGEPDNFVLRPHGIDILSNEVGTGGARMLYVITHDSTPRGPKHAIVIYRIKQDRLIFEKMFMDPLLASPNDLAVLPDGSFYTSIDSVNRGSFIDMAFSLKTGRVVYCKVGSPCLIARDEIAFPNGLLIQNNSLYLTATLENKLYRFRIAEDHTLIEPEHLADIPAGDNLHSAKQYGGGLITTSHNSGWRFLWHASDSANHSPSVVYRYTDDGMLRAIFSDDGYQISGASVALLYRDSLYIGQVFDPFLLHCSQR